MRRMLATLGVAAMVLGGSVATAGIASASPRPLPTSQSSNAKQHKPSVHRHHTPSVHRHQTPAIHR